MKILLSAVLSAAALLAGPDAAASARPLTGVVVDAATGRALPGAVVLVRWYRVRADLAHSRQVCYHAEAAVADRAGRFATPSWGALGFQDPSDVVNGMQIAAFSPGYLYGPGARWSKGQLSLVRFGGTPEEYATRIEELRRLAGDCRGEGADSVNVKSFADAVAAEARAFPFVRKPSVCVGCATHVEVLRGQSSP